MKIAIVAFRFDNKGGSERRTMHLVRGLIGKGHEVEVFADTIEDAEGMDIRTHVLAANSMSSYGKISAFTELARSAVAKRPDFDVAHCQIRPFVNGVVSVGGGCHASYLDRRAEHSGMLKRLEFKLNRFHRYVLGLEKRMYAEGRTEAIITNSRMSKRGILEHYDYPESRIHVVYNGVDTARFRPASDEGERSDLRRVLGISDDELVVIFAGSDFERKGLATVIEALRGVEGARLLVVGKGDTKPYIRAARSLGLKDIVFTGRVGDVERYYRASDVYCLPTIFDPFANTTLEAMASGLPVVTTFDNGVSEVIEEGVDGFILPSPDDSGTLRDVIMSLKDRDRRAGIGKAAAAKAARFRWDSTLEGVLDVYNTVTGERIRR